MLTESENWREVVYDILDNEHGLSAEMLSFEDNKILSNCKREGVRPRKTADAIAEYHYE
ncbi:MAG: hypothetical protein V3W20_09100 [Candidatus Neomarinimicrobiota bacterium]